VPQTTTESILTYQFVLMVISLALQKKLKRHRFHTVSYSPSTMLLAEHLTEAFTVTSFPGQPMNNKDGPNI